jgi:hypothetical protein
MRGHLRLAAQREAAHALVMADAGEDGLHRRDAPAVQRAAERAHLTAPAAGRVFQTAVAQRAALAILIAGLELQDGSTNP